MEAANMSEPKFCFCNYEVDWDDMIQCDARGGCHGWFHFRCEALSLKNVNRINQYACRGCVGEDLATTTYTNRHNEDDATSGVAAIPTGVQTHITWSDGDGASSDTNDTDDEMSDEEENIAGDAVNEPEIAGNGTPASDEDADAANQDHIMSDSEDVKSQGTSNGRPAHDAEFLKQLASRIGVGFKVLTGSDWDDDYMPDFGDFLEDIVQRNDQIMLQEGIELGMSMRDEDWAAVSANKDVIKKHLHNYGNILRRQNDEAVEKLIERYQRALPDGQVDWSAIALNYIFTWNLDEQESVPRVEWRGRWMMQDAGEGASEGGSDGGSGEEEEEHAASVDEEVDEAAETDEEGRDDVHVEHTSGSRSQSESFE